MPAAQAKGNGERNIGGVTIVERAVVVLSIATGDLCRQGSTVVVDHVGTSEICAQD